MTRKGTLKLIFTLSLWRVRGYLRETDIVDTEWISDRGIEFHQSERRSWIILTIEFDLENIRVKDSGRNSLATFAIAFTCY